MYFPSLPPERASRRANGSTIIVGRVTPLVTTANRWGTRATFSQPQKRDHTLPDPRRLGCGCDSCGAQPIMYTIWNVACTVPSSSPYSAGATRKARKDDRVESKLGRVSENALELKRGHILDNPRLVDRGVSAAPFPTYFRIHIEVQATTVISQHVVFEKYLNPVSTRRVSLQSKIIRDYSGPLRQPFPSFLSISLYVGDIWKNN